ncbi:M20 family metallopeptidase [Clostridiisalibacter paucivorans]|uniref:M20 family metallopeptidase n=1 Tax=Clostridiisalibacter paucivorans TaxID=408753 RepID=UPI00047B9C72|nr:M20 family metallopeptidase [Clostridiisalibacter paucivorans]
MNLLDFISKEEILSLITDLIRVEGHKDTEKRESDVARFIKNYFEKEGISTEIDIIEENRPNVYGYLKGKTDGINLMFNGHIDTIPGFTMDYPPFQPFVKDGKIYGRGSADMKGGITAMLSAMTAIKRAGVDLDETVMFAGVIGEEERSKGTEHLLKINIIPKNVVIGEPTDLEVSIAHKGMEWIEVKFNGKSTHGSRPHEGINAVYAASEFCKLVREELQPKVEKQEFPLLGHGTINVGLIKGGDDPNIVPDTCLVQIDRRWLPNQTLDGIHNEIKEVAQKAVNIIGGTFEVRAMREFTASMINAPHSIKEDDELVENLLDITEDVTGKPKNPVAFPAWSDAGLLGNHSDAKCVVLGPGNIVQAHANDEFCDIEQICQATEIYFNLILKMCK